MDARVAYVAFKRERVFKRILHQLVWIVQFGFEFLDVLVAVLQRGFEFLSVDLRHALRYESGYAVALRQRQLNHTRHILEGRLRGHSAVCDDMGHFFRAVFFGHIVQHFLAAVIVEVHVDIG